MICVLAVIAGAGEEQQRPDEAKLVVGKWKVANDNKDLPAGTVLEFGKDRKLKITLREAGKEEHLSGVYKVEGDRIHVTLRFGAVEEKREPLLIKRICEQELIVQPPRGATVKLRRIK
jgi:uncharacterized protein (TIGR03066 family)